METWELERTAAQYGDTIYRVALQYTGHPCDAEDVLQDVLLECFRKQNSFTSPEHERRWLLRVTINKSKTSCGLSGGTGQSPWKRCRRQRRLRSRPAGRCTRRFSPSPETSG